MIKVKSIVDKWHDFERQVERVKGEVWEVSEARAAQIVNAGFGEITEDEVSEKNKIQKSSNEKKVDESATKREENVLDDLKVDELKAMLDEKGIEYKSSDKKADLIEKLQ